MKFTAIYVDRKGLQFFEASQPDQYLKALKATLFIDEKNMVWKLVTEKGIHQGTIGRIISLTPQTAMTVATSYDDGPDKGVLMKCHLAEKLIRRPNVRRLAATT